MKTATLGLIEEDGKVLLAEKKKGEIGTDILSGPGGKLEEGESLIDCLVRETKEEWEIDLNRDDIVQVALITFFAAGEPDFKVHIYRARRFTGTLGETAEAKMPQWYAFTDLPFDRMYDGDRNWYQQAVNGEPFNANVYYRDRAKNFERIEFLPADF
jgi:ADP-ribose pyrophosphatase YjhB (NUDIX family)